MSRSSNQRVCEREGERKLVRKKRKRGRECVRERERDR